MSEMDLQKMFPKQLLGPARAFWAEFWTPYFLFPRDHNFNFILFFIKKKQHWEGPINEVCSFLLLASLSALEKSTSLSNHTGQGSLEKWKLTNFFLTSPLISPFSSWRMFSRLNIAVLDKQRWYQEKGKNEVTIKRGWRRPPWESKVQWVQRVRAGIRRD